MERKLLITVLVATTVALAGCAQQGGQPPGGGDDDGGTYALTTTGVPSEVEAGETFEFTLRIDGPAGTTDHLGAHYATRDPMQATGAGELKACAHQPGTVPGTFTVGCKIDEPGTWHLRGHLRMNDSGTFTHFWAADNVVTVGGDGLPSGETIRVGTDAAFPPFEDLNTTTNEFEGFDVDLMEEIGRRAGFTVEWMNLGFDPLIPALQNGQIDAAISAMSITQERQQQVDFSLPYYEANQSVLVRADDVETYGSFEDMEGKGLRFGAQTGTVGADQVVERFGEDSLTRYDQYPLAVAALKRGDVDAVVMDAPAQKRQAQQDNSVAIAFEFSVDDEYGIAVAKGNAALLTRINAGLATMFADGTYDRLREKWGV